MLFLSDWPAMWCSLIVWEIKPELEGVWSEFLGVGERVVDEEGGSSER